MVVKEQSTMDIREYYFFQRTIAREHDLMVVKEQSRLDIREY